ncbi:sigma-70 family RNA polymerase sigma factor [Planctomycetota bacterium]|nr:sigma-70 family RNA polymerase sigma factor [Planctomycetota bacterium]
MVKKVIVEKEENPTLSRLWSEYRDDERIEARNALIEYYRPFANMVARRLKSKLPRSVEYGDLESAGDVGLIQAVQKFDPSRGVPFEAFCNYRVRGAIIDELRRHDWVPRPMRTRLNRLKQVVQELRSELEREPSEPEIAAALGVDLEEYHQKYGGGGAMRQFWRVVKSQRMRASPMVRLIFTKTRARHLRNRAFTLARCSK